MLDDFPLGFHQFQRPCTENRIQYLEQILGPAPAVIHSMLRQCNGAKLFVNLAPLVTLFGVSPIEPEVADDWAPDWYIDKFTVAWRKSNGTDSDWAIAMTNYGGLAILSVDGNVREWDIASHCWISDAVPIGVWMDQIIVDVDEYMAS